jgi:hypothetical protein
MASPPGIGLAYQQLLDRVVSVPGVQSAAMRTLVPLGESDAETCAGPNDLRETEPTRCCSRLCLVGRHTRPDITLNFLLQVIANLVIEVSLDSLVSKQDRRRIRNLVAQRMMPLTSLQ